jgi:acyl carrier protein
MLAAQPPMSDRSVALERLRALFLQHFHVEVPSPDTDLLETGMLDWLQLVDLLLLIEEEFGRRISLQAIELDDLRSLARLAELIGTSPASTPDARTVSTGEARYPQLEVSTPSACRGRHDPSQE